MAATKGKGNVLVTTSSTPVLDASTARTKIVFYNRGAEDAWVAAYEGAVVEEGFPIEAGVTVILEKTHASDKSVQATFDAIVASGTTNITFQTFS